MILNVVVLPAPFGPSRANKVSLGMLRLTSSTTRLPLYVLETLRIRSKSLDFDTASAAAITSSLEDDIAPLSEETPLRGRKPRVTHDPESAHYMSIERRTK